ncbi:hypothetical protein MNBD_CHLOROFLEXI01-1335 [hydrothermal vent metagenome]|uniref:Uncharacterized protein n=1 Tax=hydrothermal vent metagenome TaxID=652676 RepID=A0A3B0VUE6_9ZZZZ
MSDEESRFSKVSRSLDKVPKVFGLTHSGLYDSETDTVQELVTTDGKTATLRETSIEDFANGKDVTFDNIPNDRNEEVENRRDGLKRGFENNPDISYSAIPDGDGFNCHQASDFMATGQERSPQTEKFVKVKKLFKGRFDSKSSD